ncbi:MAG: hypothetical protein Q9179_006333 [Wetmoreana sp. 5 TL-2023]
MAERTPPRPESRASSRSQNHRNGSTRSSNADIFSDEFALDSLQLSHGFSSPRPLDGANNLFPHAAQPPALGGAQSEQNPDPGPAPIRRSLGSKKTGTNSLLSRHDGPRQFPPNSARASVLYDDAPASLLDRSTSGASTFSMPRTQSPYQGATGPSHPYGMYPQDVMRTPSTATTSTVRPRERSYAGPSGPSQPYGMYPQNTVPGDEIGPVQSLHPPVPVGFPGRSQDFNRRLGPDAEDADDFVGPDGYAEQLPPYTRYPDNIPPKGGAPGPASILSAERAQLGTSEEALMNPFQSRESLAHHVDESQNSAGLTPTTSNGSPQEDKEKDFKERLKEKGKKRTCFGKIPLWVIAVLVLLLIAVLAATVGGVVGHARGEQQAAPTPPPKHNPHPPAPQSTVIATVTTTSLVDATPLSSTPANLPSLPTGTFYVPLRNLSITTNTCLSSYSMSWGCTNKADLKLDLSIPKMISVSPRYPAPLDQVYFGPQPPQLDNPVVLNLMGDRDGLDKGPAWWFQQPYTKVVVVPSVDFNADNTIPGSTKRWRDRRQHREESMRLNVHGRRAIAPPTAKPWFCYWNDTILEGFIYVTQNSSGQDQATDSEYETPASATADSDSPIASTAIYGGSPLAAYSSISGGSAMPTAPVQKRQGMDPTQLAAYSKDVKIEERRPSTTTTPPYCIQMQIMNDGTASPISDDNGKPVMIQLSEIPPDYDTNRPNRRDLWDRDASDGGCKCEWVSS